MTTTLTINGHDAYRQWGITLDQQALAALMTPASMKEYLKTESRRHHGTHYWTGNPCLEERQVTLSLNLTADNEADFFARYESFCRELATGRLTIRTSYQPHVAYKMIYLSCSQFSQFQRGIAKFALRLVEPNPADRTP